VKENLLAIARALMGRPQLLLAEGIQPSIILQIEAAMCSIVASTGISVLLLNLELDVPLEVNLYGCYCSASTLHN
jgi:ABC-type branched-subunit amino acid transport system ATPase component